jgi:hypothetical protein
MRREKSVASFAGSAASLIRQRSIPALLTRPSSLAEFKS